MIKFAKRWEAAGFTAEAVWTTPKHLADGLLAYSRGHIEATGAYAVSLTVGVQAGRYVCEELTVRQVEGGPPVTTEGLRDIPVATLIQRSAAGTFLEATALGGGEVKAEPIGEPPEMDRRHPSEAALRYVALLYRMGYLVGEPPTGLVATTLNTSRPTAARWVADARERGFLGPAEERKAGEGS